MSQRRLLVQNAPVGALRPLCRLSGKYNRRVRHVTNLLQRLSAGFQNPSRLRGRTHEFAVRPWRKSYVQTSLSFRAA